jgi:hypothetical protein
MFLSRNRKLYISSIAVYSTWQKSKSIVFPPITLAFASLLLIHPFHESQRKAYSLTSPLASVLNASHKGGEEIYQSYRA